MSSIERATVTASEGDKDTRELQALMPGGRVQSELEHVEPYGFTSEPFTDSKTDALVMYFNDSCSHGVVINVSDRRYRPTGLKAGEVVIFDDKKRKITLKRDGIEIDGVDDPITVKTNGDITINSTNATVNVHATGNLNITSDANINIAAKGEVNISGSNIAIN